jgi:exonuclease III
MSPPKKQCKLIMQPTPTPTSNMGHKISVSTLNCRGLRTSYEIVYEAINANQPDIMVLTETKLNSSMKWVTKKLERDLPDYQHHNSSHSRPDQTGLGSGGVILLIYATTINKVEVQSELAGHLCHVIPPSNGSYKHIIGVYMPAEETSTQKQIYQYIQEQATKNKTLGQTMIVGGDWNATLYPEDSPTMQANSTMDTQHQQMCHSIGLQTLRARATRQHTFHCHHQGTQHHTSRIDDFLICPAQRNPTQCEENCQEVGGGLDHLMLTQHVPAQILPLTPAITKTQPSRGMDQLVLPIKKEYLTQVHATIAAELNTTFHSETKEITTLLELCKTQLNGNYTAANLNTLRDSMPNRKEQVADMANTIMHQLRQAQPILLRICPTKPPMVGHFLKRTTAKEYSNRTRRSRTSRT